MSRRRIALAAVGLSALMAAAGCSAVGGGAALTDAQQVVADMPIGPAELKIVGGVDHADRRYRVGEPIGLTAEVNRPAHVAVLEILPNGTTTLLFPNGREKAALTPGSLLRVSAPGTSKPGAVLFEFVAAARPDSWLFSRKPEAGADVAQLGTTTRAIARDIVLSLRPGHGAETAATHLMVVVGE